MQHLATYRGGPLDGQIAIGYANTFRTARGVFLDATTGRSYASPNRKRRHPGFYSRRWLLGIIVYVWHPPLDPILK